VKKDVAQKWVEALRSGKYEQASEKLRESEEMRFCCIGVLCDIYREVRPDTEWDGEVFVVGDGVTKMDEDDEYVTDDERMEDGEAPRAVREWSGLRSNQQHDYIQLNDNGVPFAVIAAHIERDEGLNPPNAFGGPL
jgi:hypothetical protein